jgi:teichuronic acid biosynthesis glycosyltransferase TuaH
LAVRGTESVEADPSDVSCVNAPVPGLLLLVSVLFALAYQTWADAVERDMSWSADRIAQHLVQDSEVKRLVVADPLRSQGARLRRREIADNADFPDDESRSLVQPRRIRRHDSFRWLQNLRTYTRLDQWLQKCASAPGYRAPILVSCHPVLAAVADRSAWADVVYYGWDDWLNFPPFRPAHQLLSRSYAQMAERDVNVIGVTQAIVDRIGARRGSVVPNGISAADYARLGPLPSWFAELSRPIALYAGSLEERVDVAAVEQCARDLPDWTFVLVGHLTAPSLFTLLAARPNVLVRGREPRASVLAMMSASDVCLIPHRRTPMSVAMSPLKLYEYLGAGAPVVATDLPPMRGVSDRCMLVDPGSPLAPAVLAAAALPAASAAEVTAFRRENDWSRRYQRWRAAALGA